MLVLLTTPATSGRGPTSTTRSRQKTGQGGHAREVPTLTCVPNAKPTTTQRPCQGGGAVTGPRSSTIPVPQAQEVRGES